MTDKRKLIEVSIPLEAINTASAHEKAVRTGLPSNVHFWWARLSLASSRAVLFTSLVDDPSSDPEQFPTPKAIDDERSRLFGIIERLAQWENSADERVLEEARLEILRSTHGSPPAVLDPFCGGGAIPLEAQRLGLETYASDLNPVAVLITRALVEVPARFADLPPIHPDARRGMGASGQWKGATGLAEDVRRYGAWMRDEAERRIGHLFPKVDIGGRAGPTSATVVAWIWTRTVTCPNPACAARMPLVRSFVLSKKAGKQAWVEPIIDSTSKKVRFEVRSGAGEVPDGTVDRRGARCIVCRSPVPFDHVRSEGRAGRIDVQLMAIAAEGSRGRIYVTPSEEHDRVARSAMPTWAPDTDLPDEALGFRIQAYGMRRHRDLFTPRQLAALSLLCELVDEARRRAIRDAVLVGLAEDDIAMSDGGRGARGYADAIALYLACAVSNSTARNNSLVSWMLSVECPGHLFSLSAIPMAWDFAEANIIAGPSGSFGSMLEGVSRGLKSMVGSQTAVWIHQGDARDVRVPGQALVSTDPPYYDNVPYADLSDFYYVWLRRATNTFASGWLQTILTPKAAEIVADPVRFGGKRAADEHFREGLASVFRRLHSLERTDFPMTVYYAFRQSESAKADDSSGPSAATGWEAMLTALIGSGFEVRGTWPIRTARQARARALDSNAMASYVVLACRPRPREAKTTGRGDFVAALKAELPDAIRTLQRGSVAPSDFAQAAIGPGMAVFSRAAAVLEPDGTRMGITSALALINQLLDEVLTEQEGEFDADTRWAIAWYEQFGLKPAAYGTAETLSRAKNTSVEGLVEAGIVEAARGRVRLLERSEYSGNWDPAKDQRIPVWEATQRLVHVLLTDGETPAGDLLARLGGLGDTARDLAYRMYNVAVRNGWTDDARAYNALVVAWTDLARGAESARVTEPAQTSLGLE